VDIEYKPTPSRLSHSCKLVRSWILPHLYRFNCVRMVDVITGILPSRFVWLPQSLSSVCALLISFVRHFQFRSQDWTIARSYSIFVRMKCLPGPQAHNVVLILRNWIDSPGHFKFYMSKPRILRVCAPRAHTFDFLDPAGSFLCPSFPSHSRVSVTRALLMGSPVPAV
jgi:hypothetical protein